MEAAPLVVPGWVKLCGNAAPFAAIVVFLAPIPTIQQIAKDRSVGSYPLLPYTSMFSNSFLCLVYGVLKNEIKIWGTNLLGLVLACYYFLNYIQYSPPKSPTLPGSVRQHINVAVCVTVATLGFATLAPVSDPAPLIGRTSVLFCVSMFGSPLTSLKTVLQTKSAKSIPLPFTVATVVNCFLWSVFGILEMDDFNIYFPNLLGLAFGIAQVSLKLWFGDGQGVKATTELDLVL